MKPLKTLVISMVGIAAILAGYVLHNHIVKVKAARMEHAVAPAAFFPAGAIWTKDISHAPLDPQSSTIIAWLADAGGWGNNNKMQIDFGMRVLQEDAATPQVPFRKAPGFYGCGLRQHNDDSPSCRKRHGVMRGRLPAHRSRPQPRQNSTKPSRPVLQRMPL